MSPMTRTQRRPLIAVAMLAVAVATVAAGCSESSTSGAPEIVEGRTECDECHMIIDDTRFAGAYRLPDGTEKRFDDVGDMVSHGTSNGEFDDAEVYVFDYYTKDALVASEATFVIGPETSTPMGSGVLALGDEADAAGLAGEVVDWDGLLEIASEGGLDAETRSGGS